jgi:hypothetical protein
MYVKLAALIEKTTAALEAEKDARKRTRLQAQLSAYQSTLVDMKAGADDGDGDEDDEGDEDDSKSKKAAAKAEEAKRKAAHAKHMEKAAVHKAKAAEYEEKARKCLEGDEEDDDESEEESKKASVSVGGSDAASAAIAAQAQMTSEAVKRVNAVEARLAEREKSAQIAEAKANGQITPYEAKMLAGKSPTWVSEYIATREGVRVVATEDGHIVQPHDGGADLPAAALKEIDERIATLGLTDKSHIDKLRADMIASRKRLAVNGAAERF